MDRYIVKRLKIKTDENNKKQYYSISGIQSNQDDLNYLKNRKRFDFAKYLKI